MALVTSLTAAFLLGGAWAATGAAMAQAYLPPAGQIFQGVTDEPASAYATAIGKHPAVYQEFIAWGEYLPAMFGDALAARARPMIAISTAYGTREAITPAAIADGQGDAWLIGLNHAIAATGHVVFVRLMAEMDAYWNPYSAYGADGGSRGASHSTAAYRQAWKRVTLILRGGPLAHIDRVLKRLGMPGLHWSSDLPVTRVAMLWVPQVSGTPALAGNQPQAYWPGRAWVDWVGTDFYSKFPNFAGLSSFYSQFRSEPFAFGEYAMWGADDPGFVSQLFAWIGSHARVRMLVYNQGARSNGPFRLSRYPNAARELRKRLASGRFPASTADWQP